jgi:hypothetical protein
MILPNFILSSRIGLIEHYSGIDSPKYCRNKDHFESYPYAIEYRYNSRGYRDQEWPTDLNNAIWCLGDSFTEGLGSPIEHTWPYLLQQTSGQRCINVSLDGASNDWILRKANELLDQLQPSAIVIHLSYLHRGENPNSLLSDEDRRMSLRAGEIDTPNWISRLQQDIHKLNQRRGRTKIVYSFIPEWAMEKTFAHEWRKIAGPDWCHIPHNVNSWQSVPTFVKKELLDFGLKDLFLNWTQLLDTMQLFVPEFEVEDHARDYHHYGLVTAQKFALSVSQLLRQPLI